jgi:hypothetical protein
MAVFIAFAANAAAQTNYFVTLGNMTAWNGVAHAIDTTYISLSVKGPNGQVFSKTYGPNKLHRNQRTNWALSSTPINVPADAQSTLTISWAAINKGTTSLQQIGETLSNAAASIGQSGGSPIGVIASTIGGALGGHFLQSCDVPLFGGSATFTGAQLAAGQLGGRWSPEGPGMWHVVYDYPNIHSPCDTGHYNLEIHIKRQ